MKLLLGCLLFVLLADSSFAATLYLDKNLAADCTSNNYSISSYPKSTCTGSDGNAYNDVSALVAASATNDTINVRTDSITSNVSGAIVPKNGQTWQTYPGDMPNRATITASATSTEIFDTSGTASNITIKNLILRGGAAGQWGLYIKTTGGLFENIDLANFDASNSDWVHGIAIIYPSSGVTVRGNYVHAPGLSTAANVAGIATLGCTLGADASCSVSDAAALVENNTVDSVPVGIWADVNSGNPDKCDSDNACTTRDPHTIRNNTVSNAQYCIQIEARSAATYTYNLLYNCSKFGISVRPSGIIRQIVFQRNTIYNVGWVGVFLENEDPPISSYYTSHFDDNIIWSSSTDFAAMVIGAPASEATNSFNNNLIYSTTAPYSVCWNNPTTGMGVYCSGGTNYALNSGGVSQFNTDVAVAAGNIFGNPNFVTPGSDFHLQSSSSAIAAGQGGADIGALPYHRAVVISWR